MSTIFRPAPTPGLLVDESLLDPIAEAMVTISANVQPTDNVFIYYHAGASQLARMLAQRSALAGANVYAMHRDLEMDAVLASRLSERNIARSTQLLDLAIRQADVVFLLRCSSDDRALATVPKERLDAWDRARQPVYSSYRVKHTRWVLLYWPTREEADADRLEYEDYLRLFLNACNQPWREIARAQAVLVEALNQAQALEIVANPHDPDPDRRTHLAMDIAPMRFANSTIDHNFPGSEVFAAPVRESVQGQLFAPGRYEFEGKRMEDLRLVVRDGRIAEATARVGEAELNAILDTDPGARYFGEVAIGTNPGLRQRLLNPLLNEKVGGSFHITPGRAYDLTEYCGQSVKLDNGNRSLIHWDIAVSMLPPTGGALLLDGKKIQEDGRFLLPGLEVLNAGL